MASYSDKETDKILAELEARIVEVYDKAQSEVEKAASDYFASFKDRYEKEYEAFMDGKYTPQQFAAWYQAQVGRGERWEHLRDKLAQRLTDANKVAAAYVNDTTPGIYSLNANYQAYEIYQNTGVDFALVDESTVRRLLMSDELDILPLNLNVEESERWNAKQLTNALTSGIIRGQSIGKIADEFQRVTNMDRTSALRNARTATTGAQNAGRQDTYNRAAEMGIEIEKEWIATEDSRTRESHAEMDGVRIKYSETFPNGLEYPGDPSGPPEEVYNCRCTVRAIIPKYNGEQRESHIEGHEGLHTKESYKEWVDRKREEKMEKSKPYTHADATSRGMAAVEDRISFNPSETDMMEFKPQYGSDIKKASFENEGTVYETKIVKLKNSDFDIWVEKGLIGEEGDIIQTTINNLQEFKENNPESEVPRVIITNFWYLGYNENALGGYYKKDDTFWINSIYDTNDKIEKHLKQTPGYFARTDYMGFYEHEILGHKQSEDYIKELAKKESKEYNEVKIEAVDRVIEELEKWQEKNPNVIVDEISIYALNGLGGENKANITNELIAECATIKDKPIAKAILDAFYGG